MPGTAHARLPSVGTPQDDVDRISKQRTLPLALEELYLKGTPASDVDETPASDAAIDAVYEARPGLRAALQRDRAPFFLH